MADESAFKLRANALDIWTIWPSSTEGFGRVGVNDAGVRPKVVDDRIRSGAPTHR